MNTQTKRDMAWVLRQLCQRKPKDVDAITNLDLMRADMSVRFVSLLLIMS